MKRQTENVTTRVYSYGSVSSRIAPVLNEDLALTQMRLARRLWNVRVSIDRARTARYRRIMRDDVQEQIDLLREKKDVLYQELKRRRKAARSKVAAPDLDAELKRTREALTLLLAERKQTKEQRHTDRRAELDAMSERERARIKKARQAAASMGLFWGTYNAILQNADAGRKLGELKYRSFRGEGTVTAQIQGGTSPAECVGANHTFFRMQAPGAGNRWRYACVRIGSAAPSMTPIWVGVPIIYHRDIPPEAIIKSVSATRRLVAGKARWQVNVTVTLPPVEQKLPGRAIAVDIGWRLLPHGVRVAYWYDDAGKHGEVVVSSRDIAAFAKVRDLRSICDKSRDVFLPQLAEWLGKQTLGEEWQKRTAFVSQWRSPDRLAALIRWWSDNRLAGDGEMYDTAIAWRKQYLHLANWWRNQLDQMTVRVREQHRVFAASIARNYATVVLEDFDLRPVVESKPGDSGQAAGSNYRQMVSPSGFRAALVNACKREGVEVRIAPGAYTTATCHHCGTVETFDQVADLLHRCHACGTLWDQDFNAAVNLLARGRGMTTKDQQDTPEIPGVILDRSQGGPEVAGKSVA